MKLQSIQIICLVFLLVVPLESVYSQTKGTNHSSFDPSKCDSALQRISKFLHKRIPELNFFDRYLDEVSNYQVHSILYIEDCPNSYSIDTLQRNYFRIYYGEDHSDHTVRTYTFFVKKNFSNVLVYDEFKDIALPLPYVRKSKDWKDEWEERRKDYFERTHKQEYAR